MAVEFYDWQQELIDEATLYYASGVQTFLLQAWTGTGKTYAGLGLAQRLLREGLVDWVFILSPQSDVRDSWATDGAAFGLDITSDWDEKHTAAHGISLTWSFLWQDDERIRKLLNRHRRVLVIADEVHRLSNSDKTKFGPAFKEMQNGTRTVTCALSATPFRTDRELIPHLTYSTPDAEGQIEAQPNFRVGYRRGLDDGILPEIFFEFKNSLTTYEFNGDEIESEICNEANEVEARLAMDTALKKFSEFTFNAINYTICEVDKLRKTDPKASALFVCVNYTHAKSVASIIRILTGVEPVLVSSHETGSADLIKAFKTSNDPYIVSVRMVSEGVNIPRLRYLCWLSNIKSELSFIQIIGRLLRGTKEVFAVLPSLPLYKQYAKYYQEIVISFREKQKGGGGGGGLGRRDFVPGASTFEEDEVISHAGSTIPSPILDLATLLKRKHSIAASIADIARDLGSLGSPPPPNDTKPIPPQQIRKALKGEIHRVVAGFCKRTGVEFSHVRATLNRAVGVRSVHDCDIEKLESQLALAKTLEADDFDSR